MKLGRAIGMEADTRVCSHTPALWGSLLWLPLARQTPASSWVQYASEREMLCKANCVRRW